MHMHTHAQRARAHALTYTRALPPAHLPQTGETALDRAMRAVQEGGLEALQGMDLARSEFAAGGRKRSSGGERNSHGSSRAGLPNGMTSLDLVAASARVMQEMLPESSSGDLMGRDAQVMRHAPQPPHMSSRNSGHSEAPRKGRLRPPPGAVAPKR